MKPETAQKRLRQMLAELDGSAATLQGEHTDGDLSQYDPHPADSASDMSDADREEAVLEVVVRQRDAVQAALARIDAGTFGNCVDCGRALPDERLEARPEAPRCVDCQQRAEGGR